MITKNISFLTRILMDKPRPEVVSINLTAACNQRCKYCEIGMGRVKVVKPLLTEGDVKWIIDQMAELGIPLLSMGGGEPLLVPWLWEILDYADKRGIKTELVTNGMRIPDLTPEQVSNLRKTSNISVSIDSINEGHEDYIRGVDGALKKQLEAIKLLRFGGIPFSIATVLSNINYLDLEDLVKTMGAYGARYIKFQPVWTGTNFPGTDASEKQPLVIKEENVQALMAGLQKVVDYEQEGTIKTNAKDLLRWVSLYLKRTTGAAFFQTFVKKYWCHSIHAILTINYYGDILQCNYRPVTRSIKLREEGTSLMDMWNEVCSDARTTFNKGWHFKECHDCANSLEMGIIGSGIRHPINNCAILPDVAKMAINKFTKQKVMR